MPLPSGIVSVDLLHATREVAIEKDWTKAYTLNWRVITNAPTVSAKTVLSASPVSLGDVYEEEEPGPTTITDPISFCQSIRANCVDEDGRGWILTATYGPYDPTVNPASPLDRPLEISFDYESIEEVVDEDRLGNPVVNSAKDYFDPPVTRPRRIRVVTCTRYETSFSVSTDESFEDAINTGEFLGAAPRTVKLSPIKRVLMRDPLVGWLWKSTYEFRYNRRGWRTRVLDQGLRRLAGTSPEKRIPIIVGGTITQSPCLLNGSGQPLALDGSPYYREFQIDLEQAFAALGFSESDFPGVTF